MENKNMESIDILSELETLTTTQKIENEENTETVVLEEATETLIEVTEDNFDLLIEEAELTFKREEEKELNKKSSIQTNIFKNILFFFKYISTSALIFTVLLVSTNYNAYINLAVAYLNEEELNKNEELLISSVKASYIQEKIEEKNEKEEIYLEEGEESKLYKRNMHSIKKLINKTSKENVDLNIEITPYENRVIIPKI